MFAGGLRSRRNIEARKGGQVDRPGGLGTNTGVRLEQTDTPCSEPHLRPARHAVLGQGSFDRQTVRRAAINRATELLPPRARTVGFGRRLSQRSAMGRLAAGIR